MRCQGGPGRDRGRPDHSHQPAPSGNLIRGRYTFTAPANNLYTFRSFGAEGASGILYRYGDASPIAEGEGFSFSARLISGARYLLVVKGGSGAQVEIMRDALGRSFDRPIQLGNLADGYDKVIARAYDTHWYAFTAPLTGGYVIATSSEIDTLGYLMDPSGRVLATSDDAYADYERNFLMEADLSAGQTYLLRVSARGNMTGAYHLTVLEPEAGAPALESLTMSLDRVQLRSGDVTRLSAAASPAGARALVRWVSTDLSVAKVTQEGEVIAIAPGECEVIAYAGGRAEAKCRVTVQSIPLQEVHFELDALELPRRQTAALNYAVMPLDASDQRMRFSSSDESVATVDGRGVVTAVSEGRAVITVTSVDGGRESSLTVTVTPRGAGVPGAAGGRAAIRGRAAAHRLDQYHPGHGGPSGQFRRARRLQGDDEAGQHPQGAGAGHPHRLSGCGAHGCVAVLHQLSRRL